jgi:hypothetical protein
MLLRKLRRQLRGQRNQIRIHRFRTVHCTDRPICIPLDHRFRNPKHLQLRTDPSTATAIRSRSILASQATNAFDRKKRCPVVAAICRD